MSNCTKINDFLLLITSFDGSDIVAECVSQYLCTCASYNHMPVGVKDTTKNIENNHQNSCPILLFSCIMR